MASAIVTRTLHNLTGLLHSKPQARTRSGSRRTISTGTRKNNQIRCEAPQQLVTMVKNGKDSLEICRILNGMWQTRGGWGSVDRDDAVEAMLKHADAGLTTFDMADHCKIHELHI